MSYENFKRKIWAKAIDRELERAFVFADGTNQQYSGEIKGLGDTVRILGVGKPTVTEHDLINGDITLSSPEKVSDTSVSLVVDKAAYFNYAVGDIDKAQGAGNVMAVLNTEASEEVANVIDKHIANLVHPDTGTVGLQMYNNGTPLQITNANVMSTLDACQALLYANDVSPATEVEMILPPWLYMAFRQAYQNKDTDNSEYLTNGKVARYGNMTIKMSNNVAMKTSGGHDNYYVQIRTKRAIAVAMSEAHTEPYRPESKFEDAVKGFKLYGAKVVRPKELIVLPCYA
jgi:hypothetical protein